MTNLPHTRHSDSASIASTYARQNPLGKLLQGALFCAVAALTVNQSNADSSLPSVRIEGGQYLATTGVEAVLSPFNCSSGIGDLSLQYQGGDSDQRGATLVQDPANPDNQALKFWTTESYIGGSKGRSRVQMNAYGLADTKTLDFSVRMYLPKDMAKISNYNGTSNFLTISEWWNDAGWATNGMPFRISVNLVKLDASVGSPLVLDARAQVKDPTTNQWADHVWFKKNRDYPLPTGEWMTLKYHFEEGNGNNGRFSIDIVDNKGYKHSIIDVTNWTYHPDAKSPDGISMFNPIKLYTSYKLTDFMASQNADLNILWDDIRFTNQDNAKSCQFANASPPAAPDDLIVDLQY